MRIGMLHQTLFWPIVILVSFKFTQKDVHFPRDKRIGMKHSVFLDKTWVSLECLVKCPFIFYLRQVHLNNLSPTSSDLDPIWFRKLELCIESYYEINSHWKIKAYCWKTWMKHLQHGPQKKNCLHTQFT